MYKRPAILAFVCVGLLVPASALAAMKTFTITSKAAVLNPGNYVRLLGGVTEGTFGEGGLVVHNKIITKNTGRSTYTVFTKTGSVSDVGELWWLVRSASWSRARCGIYGGGEYVSINDVG